MTTPTKLAQSYAVFRYDYTHYSSYRPKFVNLGDYVQSLAASQYWGAPHGTEYTLDRDQLSHLPASAGLIANGWYWLHDDHHLFPEESRPLLSAVHIENDSVADFPQTLQQWQALSKRSAIGCRDRYTEALLTQAGCEAYFSGCLTTTLRRENFATSEELYGVVFSDLPQLNVEALGSHVSADTRLLPPFGPHRKWLQRFKDARFQKTHAALHDRLLQHYQGEPITVVSHEVPLGLSAEEAFAKACALLSILARAKLVVTSRLHAALPCLALGTPVILVTKYDRKRFSGMEDWVNHVWTDTEEVSVLEEGGEVKNPEHFRPYAARLREQCERYVKEQPAQ